MLKFLYLLKIIYILAIYLQRKLLFNLSFKAEENVFCIFKSALIFSYIIFYAFSSWNFWYVPAGCFALTASLHLQQTVFILLFDLFFFVLQFSWPVSFSKHIPHLSLDLLMLFFHIYLQLPCRIFPLFFLYIFVWNSTRLLYLISIFGVTNCFPSSQVNLKVVKLLFTDSQRVVIAFVRTVSKMNPYEYIVQLFDFIRTDNFEEIKSTNLHLLLCDHVKQSCQVFFSCLALPKPFCA